MDIRLNIIAFLKENKDERYSSRELFKLFGGDYDEFMQILFGLVLNRIVRRVRVSEGRKKYEYFID